MNRIKKIQRGFADMLEIDSSLIAIARPSTILKGLRMDITININHNKAMDMGIEGVLERYIQSGHIAATIQKAWGLQQVPMVSNLKVSHIAETDKQQNIEMAAIRVTSNSMLPQIQPIE